jgi:hypothetical protein
MFAFALACAVCTLHPADPPRQRNVETEILLNAARVRSLLGSLRINGCKTVDPDPRISQKTEVCVFENKITVSIDIFFPSPYPQMDFRVPSCKITFDVGETMQSITTAPYCRSDEALQKEVQIPRGNYNYSLLAILLSLLSSLADVHQ